MPILAFLQVAEAPAWASVTIAISLAIIAVTLAAFLIVVIAALAAGRAQAAKLHDLLRDVQDDVKGTIKTVHRLTEQAQDLMLTLRHEAGAYAQTSRRLRRKIVRGMDRVEERLEDLDALYSVVHEEVEDTALDVAATLRSVRTGRGMISRVRRMLVPGR